MFEGCVPIGLRNVNDIICSFSQADELVCLLEGILGIVRGAAHANGNRVDFQTALQEPPPWADAETVETKNLEGLRCQATG